MIDVDKLVTFILNFLTTQNVISKENDVQDFYKYGIEISISSLLNIIVVVLLGAITGTLIESIIFLFVFIFLRSFTGGLHTSTYLRCNLTMYALFLLTAFIYIHIDRLSVNMLIIMAAVSMILISLLCPIEHKNKPITSKKRKVFLKIISIALSTLLSAAGIILATNSIKPGIMIVLTVLLVSIMVVVSLVKKGVEKHDRTQKEIRNAY